MNPEILIKLTEEIMQELPNDKDKTKEAQAKKETVKKKITDTLF